MTEQNFKYRTDPLFLRNQFYGIGKYGMPLIPKFEIREGDFEDLRLIGFDVAKTEKDEHFFYSLNEIVIRNLLLNTCHFDVIIENSLLQHYVGDGMLIATSSGSTAYNLSFGGSIVFDDFHSLQLTPIAPLNSKVYRSLRNSIIIPENKMVTIVPKKDKKNFLITVDGENYPFEGVEKVETVVDKKKIRFLRFSSNFVDKVYDKFLN